MEKCIDKENDIKNYSCYDIDIETLGCYKEKFEFIGRVLKDGTSFEGIVTEQSKKENWFVFGTIYNENVNLLICSKNDDHDPKQLTLNKKEEGKYSGKYYLAKNKSMEIVGTSKMLVADPLDYRDSSYEENKLLDKRTASIKKYSLGNLSQKLYTQYQNEQKRH